MDALVSSPQISSPQTLHAPLQHPGTCPPLRTPKACPKALLSHTGAAPAQITPFRCGYGANLTASPALAVHASSHLEENSKSPPKLVPREIPRPGPLRYPRPTQMRRANDLASTSSCCGMRSAVLPDWAPVDPQPRRGASGVQDVTWATSKPPIDQFRPFTLDQNNPPRVLWSKASHSPP